MINSTGFKEWLINNTAYSAAVVDDIVSRMNRADRIMAWQSADPYIFYLEQNKDFLAMTVSVKSQVRKAVKYYYCYYNNCNKILEDKPLNDRDESSERGM